MRYNPFTGIWYAHDSATTPTLLFSKMDVHQLRRGQFEFVSESIEEVERKGKYSGSEYVPGSNLYIPSYCYLIL